MQRHLLTFIAVPALAFGLAACGSSSKPASAGPTPTTASAGTTAPATADSSGPQITIDGSFKFTTTPVKAGATVTVKNNSASQHTVSASDTSGGFDVTVDAGKTATFTAPSKPGTYKFHCNIHNFMMGTLTVN